MHLFHVVGVELGSLDAAPKLDAAPITMKIFDFQICIDLSDLLIDILIDLYYIIYIYYTSFSRDFHHLNLVSYQVERLRYRAGTATLTGRRFRCAVLSQAFFGRCRPGIWCWTSSAQFARHQLTSWLDAQKISCLRNDLCKKYADMGIVNSVEDFAHIDIYIYMQHYMLNESYWYGWQSFYRNRWSVMEHNASAPHQTSIAQMTCTGHHWYGAVPDSEKNSCKPWELYGIVIFMHSGATKLQEQVQSLIPKSASCRSELREAAPMLLRSHCGSISDQWTDCSPKAQPAVSQPGGDLMVAKLKLKLNGLV